jgi:hypothetical protein
VSQLVKKFLKKASPLLDLRIVMSEVGAQLKIWCLIYNAPSGKIHIKDIFDLYFHLISTIVFLA